MNLYKDPSHNINNQNINPYFIFEETDNNDGVESIDKKNLEGIQVNEMLLNNNSNVEEIGDKIIWRGRGKNESSNQIIDYSSNISILNREVQELTKEILQNAKYTSDNKISSENILIMNLRQKILKIEIESKVLADELNDMELYTLELQDENDMMASIK